MSSGLTILAFAAVALAAPFRPSGFEPSGHHHHPTGTGAPFGLGNSTGPYGTAGSTGLHRHSSSAKPTTFSEVAPVSSVAGAAVTDSTTTCTSSSTVTVTFTNKVTVTVEPTFAETSVSSGYAAPSTVGTLDERRYSWHRSSTAQASSSSSAAAASSSSSAAAAVSSAAASSSSSAIAAAASSSVSSSAIAAAPTSVVAAATSTLSLGGAKAVSTVAPSSASSASSAAASSTGSTSSYGSGKRGMAYDSTSTSGVGRTAYFKGSKYVSWGYTWGQSSMGLDKSFEFVPMLWGNDAGRTSTWNSTVVASYNNGSRHFLSFNEPDLGAQANIGYAQAASDHIKYMNPIKGNFSDTTYIGSPAVTNGGTGLGLDYLKSWMGSCNGKCNFDFTPIHWYDSATNIAYFKSHLQDAYNLTGKPVWVTEFGASGSDADVNTFLQTVMPWMDSQDWIQRYSYFMVSDGKLCSGSGLSTYGTTFNSYSGSS